MSDPRFFAAAKPLSLDDIASHTGAELRGDGDCVISNLAPIESAGSGDLSYVDNAAYIALLADTRAAACVLSPKLLERAPDGLNLLISPDPYRTFAQVAGLLYPSAMRPIPIFEGEGIAPGAYIHPEARLEPNVTIDPGVVIGPRAEIGSGTRIAANAIIGPDVRIGRDCSIGPGASVLHSLIGNRVTVHAGARIGQDGFGFAMGAQGHLKVPQLGRVILQDDVDIGSCTCVDRGSTRDTIVGEGTKIDNLCQIAHNVVIGRHCVVVSMVGISGSTTVGDYVVIGGQAGIAGHLDIGAGAQIAGKAMIMSDVPAKGRWGGMPGQPLRTWFREVAWLRRQVGRDKN